MGWKDAQAALDRPMQMWWSNVYRKGRIVGVTRDFHLFSLRDAVTPVVVTVMPAEHLNFLSVRFDAGQARPVLAHLEGLWRTFAPAYPFDYYFVDADFDRLHRADLQLGQAFRAFAVLALLVACLGLFGLAAFTAEQRTKEIGVRKVMGASAAGIVALLARDFTRLVLVAFGIAGPLAYLALHRWLEQFAYRLPLDARPFLLAGAAAVLLAFATVSYQSLRAALADPVKALRHE
jgi:putative ABC transport system permease protein